VRVGPEQIDADESEDAVSGINANVRYEMSDFQRIAPEAAREKLVKNAKVQHWSISATRKSYEQAAYYRCGTAG